MFPTSPLQLTNVSHSQCLQLWINSTNSFMILLQEKTLNTKLRKSSFLLILNTVAVLNTNFMGRYQCLLMTLMCFRNLSHKMDEGKYRMGLYCIIVDSSWSDTQAIFSCASVLVLFDPFYLTVHALYCIVLDIPNRFRHH